MTPFTRRDFLKLSLATSGSLALSRLMPAISATKENQNTSLPGVVILVFDAMSARNLSLYGYKRPTTPNLERFAQKATVYNAHYSAGTFTSPGTASLLTGLYPWTHRAFNEAGLIARNVVERNIFQLAGEKYHRLAFSQNTWPNYFFGQFRESINKILPTGSFSLIDHLVGDKLGKDSLNGQRAFEDFLFQNDAVPPSLVFGLAERLIHRYQLNRAHSEGYPNGLPRTGSYPVVFRIEEVIDGLIETIKEFDTPTMAYFHLYPPHSPYAPTESFFRSFQGDNFFVDKPDHVLGDHDSVEKLNNRRRVYDEYIASLDQEFGRLYDFLESSGFLEKNYVVVTSDHGEMFERGVMGHNSPLLYDAGVQVPLIISAPGQRSRQDVYLPTVSVDIVPTLSHLMSGKTPDWHEGEVLPLLGGQEKPGRSIFTMYAMKNPAFEPLKKISLAMRKDQYKLIYYRAFNDYNREDRFELYDLEGDREELRDLYPDDPAITRSLRDELLGKLEDVNSLAPYMA